MSYRSLEDALAASDPRWERSFLCPVHDDHNASASVNVQKGVWVCYTCGAAGRTGEAGLVYAENLDLQYIDSLLAEKRVYDEQWLNLYAQPHPYWRSRFTDAACEHFQLGRDPVTGEPVYPIRDELGNVLGVVIRYLDPERRKYKYPAGVQTHKLLFNYFPGQLDDVILVEGAMDVVACFEVAYHALGIYGSHLSKEQAELIYQLEPRRVFLAFDNDHAGRKCTREAEELLGEVVEVHHFPWKDYAAYNDLGDMDQGLRFAALQRMINHS